MPVHVPDHDWTVERALALPEDGNRYEVLDGELFVTPSPTWGHQSVLDALHARLRAYVAGHRLGWTRFSPADLVFSPRRLLQPDLFVVPWQDSGPPRAWSEVRSLLLAVEVLSPSTARADRHRKRSIYQSERVSEYWIIDGDARLIERWRPEDVRPEIIVDALVWRPHEELPPFELALDELFDEAAR